MSLADENVRCRHATSARVRILGWVELAYSIFQVNRVEVLARTRVVPMAAVLPMLKT